MTPDVPTGYPVLSGETLVAPILGDPIAQVKSPDGVTRALVARGRNAVVVPMHVDVARLKPDTFVGDVITKPAVPPLIAAARRVGCGTSTGSDMFAAVSGLIVDFLVEEDQ